MTNRDLFEGTNIPESDLIKPRGWRILIGMLKIEELSAGGIALPNEHRRDKEYLRSIAIVLAMGELAYLHEKFQGGVPLDIRTPKRWCEVGDIITLGQYAGQSITLLDSTDNNNPQSLKFINDDDVMGVVQSMKSIAT